MNDNSLNLPVIWKWGKRVGFSVLDQGLFSGANFLLNILLARWLSPEEYGAFAVAFAVFLFLSGFHNALILDPMAVFGSMKQIASQMVYIYKLFFLQLILTGILSLLLILSGLFFQSPTKHALVGFGITIPFLLSVWFFRQSFYLKSEPDKAAIISGIYIIGLVGGLIRLRFTNTFSLHSIFWILCAACLLPILVGFLLHQNRSATMDKIFTQQIIKENWGYGKWVVLTAFSNGITALSFTPLIGIMLGLREAAAFKGWQNLINPMQQILGAGALLMVPHLAKNNLSNGNYLRPFKKSILVTIMPTTVYILFIMVFSKPLISLVYHQNFYLEYRWLIIAFSLYLLILAVNTIVSVFLRAQKLSKAIFLGKTISAGIFVLSIPLLLWVHSLNGIMVAYILLASAETIALFIFLIRSRTASQ